MDAPKDKESESVQKNNSLEGNKGETPQVNNKLKGKIYEGRKGKYQILDSEHLDKGGIGTIWRAAKCPVNIVVIKVLDSNKFNLDDPKHWIRFEREQRHGASLEQHPNLVTILDYGKISENRHFLVMEYIDGKSISQSIEDKEKQNIPNQVDKEERCQIALAIIDGLEKIHNKGFVHRDLKPDNILITDNQDRRAVICDYGLLKHKKDATVTGMSDVAGSGWYMSPRQTNNPANADQNDDIYSLFICLFEIFSGRKLTNHVAANLATSRRWLKYGNDNLNSLICKVVKDIEWENSLEDISEKCPKLDDIRELIQKIPTETVKSGQENPEPPVNGWKWIKNIWKWIKKHYTEISVAAVCLLLLLGYLYIDSLKYRLTIKTTPEDARVRIVKPEMEYKPRMELKWGKYDVEVSHTNFKQVYHFEIDMKPIDIIKGTHIFKEAELERSNDYGMKFVYIPPGTFQMGSPVGEDGYDDPENAIAERMHSVTITEGFYMQTTEVTQGQWFAIMRTTNRSPSSTENCGDREKECPQSPVNNVSWDDVQKFIEELNRRENTNRYRLQTEAEWEYACRARTETAFSFGECLSTDKANYDGSIPFYYSRQPDKKCPEGGKRDRLLPVGSLSPNNWGLYDMHGNVVEWCQDVYQRNIVDRSPLIEGSGDRIVRGGAYDNSARYCRSAYRSKRYHPTKSKHYNRGFRLVMTRTENTQ